MDTETPETGQDAPINCTLSTKEAAEQVLDWTDLRHQATSVTAIQGGVSMTFAASLADEVQELARSEATCCSFLTINTSVTGNQLTLSITSANPEGMPIINTLAGLPQT